MAILTLLAAVSARAQTTQAVGIPGNGGITIQVTSVYNGVPSRGFLPLRVSITNSSNSDGVWDVTTQAVSDVRGAGHYGAQATCAVPAHQTQIFEVLAPIAPPQPNPGGINRGQTIVVHVSGPGPVNADVQFTPYVQSVPNASLSVMVPVALGRGGRGSGTTSTITSSNGTTTRTTTTTQADGSTIVTVLVTNPDGTTSTNTTRRSATGQITGNNTYLGNTTINGNTVVGGSLSVGSGGSVSVSNGGTLTINGATPFAATTSASGAPPPPPPPPPPYTGGTIATGGLTFTGGRATVTLSSGPRGVRGVVGRSVRRDAGAALFIGLSPTLGHDLGDKIKTYFTAVCVRPLQQTTLDPDLASADWRAYVGFDLLFYTSADWLAAPPGVRLAITQWVATGGDLRIIADSDGGLDLPPRLGERYGAGRIELFTEDELAQYNYTIQHSNPAERFLFSPDYQPVPPSPPGTLSLDLPVGFEKREFSVSEATLSRLMSFDPIAAANTVANVNNLAENELTSYFTNQQVGFPKGAKLNFYASAAMLAVVNTKPNLDAIADLLKSYGEPDGVVMGFNPEAPANSAGPPAAKTFEEAAPRLRDQSVLIAFIIVAFGILVGPLNLFWFCNGPRRPHLLWVTPLLAVATSAAIMAFILLAEGIGGHGIYFRITQLAPEGKFAVESEAESSVTGVLTHRDFELPNIAWLLDYGTTVQNDEMSRGNFIQAGPRYTGDWFASRRKQLLVAQTVAPSRAALHVAAVDGQPPVLTSEYNDWMQNLFYEDPAGHYWKIARISDGQPTPLQAATAEEFAAAWDENLNGAPAELTAYLGKLTPRPGEFFALGNGGNSTLEPDLPGLRWAPYRHVITGPVIP